MGGPLAPSAPGSRRWANASGARFLARRLGALLIVLWVVEVATFLMVRLIPGNPAREVLGPHATDASVAALNHQLGLDEPILRQYFQYTGQVLRGNFGTSFYTHLPVSTEISSRIGAELQLIGAAVGMILIFGISLGLLVGGLTKEGRHPIVERLFVMVTGIIGSIPGYVVATVLALVFAVTWKLFPVAGNSTPDSVVLPALSIALPYTALLARIVRVETLGVLGQNYVRSARSKRLGGVTIYTRYVLPNVLTAALTLGGTIFTQTVGSAIIVENVFAWNGLGLLLTQSVLRQDYPVVQGTALLLGLIVVLINALVDIGVSLVDPRSASQRGLELG